MYTVNINILRAVLRLRRRQIYLYCTPIVFRVSDSRKHKWERREVLHGGKILAIVFELRIASNFLGIRLVRENHKWYFADERATGRQDREGNAWRRRGRRREGKFSLRGSSFSRRDGFPYLKGISIRFLSKESIYAVFLENCDRSDRSIHWPQWLDPGAGSNGFFQGSYLSTNAANFKAAFQCRKQVAQSA